MAVGRGRWKAAAPSGTLHPYAKHTRPQNSYTWPYPVLVKIPFKNSWIRIVIRISTKIEWFVASGTSRRRKIRKNSSTIYFVLSATFVELPYVAVVKKIILEISCIRIVKKKFVIILGGGNYSQLKQAVRPVVWPPNTPPPESDDLNSQPELSAWRSPRMSVMRLIVPTPSVYHV